MSDQTRQSLEQPSPEQPSLEQPSLEQPQEQSIGQIVANTNEQKSNFNLDRLKEEGKLRGNNIKQIVKEAVSQALSELKAGSGEIGQIVKNTVSATVADLRSRERHDPQEVAASIEGAIDGSTYQRRQEIAQHRARLQELQAQIDEQQRLLDQEVENALIDIDANAPEDRIKLAVSQAVSSVKESQASSTLKQQFFNLKSQIEGLDQQLLTRYGDRYVDVKHQWESAKANAKTWYEHTKAEAETNGMPALQQKQAEVENDLADFGVTVARKEQEIKERLVKTVRSFLPK